jgi:hypothetical protein
MSSPAVIRVRALVSGVGALLLGAALLAPLAGCGDREDEELQPDHPAGTDGTRAQSEAQSAAVASSGDAAALDADVAALASLLAGADESVPLDDSQRQALEQTMQRILEPAAVACAGCRSEVSYVDEAGGGDHFRCDLRGAAGDPMVEVEIYHRRELATDAAKTWARTTVAGHPASALAGEHLFVWPGRFEIRAFGRAEPGAASGISKTCCRACLSTRWRSCDGVAGVVGGRA